MEKISTSDVWGLNSEDALFVLGVRALARRVTQRRRGGEGMMGRLLSGSGGEWSSSATMGARESSTNTPHLSADAARE